jgi:hypothetical protein
MYLLSNTAGLDYCAVIDGPDSAIMPSATHTSQATIVDNATRFLTDPQSRRLGLGQERPTNDPVPGQAQVAELVVMDPHNGTLDARTVP